jgi:hypothetical protein
MSKPAIVAAILPAAAWWWTNPSLLRLQYLNQVRMRSIIPVPTSKHGPTRLTRLSQCPPANERDFRIDGHAPTPQSSLRRRRHFSAADTDLTCHRQACLERSTAYHTHGAYTVELTDISHWE